MKTQIRTRAEIPLQNVVGLPRVYSSYFATNFEFYRELLRCFYQNHEDQKEDFEKLQQKRTSYEE